jgi:hypothetical protein
MSAEKEPPRETLRLVDGDLVSTPATSTKKRPRIIGADHESTQVLMALGRIDEVITMFYGARMAERIFGDTKHRVAAAMQQRLDDLTQADLILQNSWAALSVNFRSFIHRHTSVTSSACLGGAVPRQAWSDFRQVITAVQEAEIAKERTERVVETLTAKVAKAELVAAQALSAALATSGKSSRKMTDSRCTSAQAKRQRRLKQESTRQAHEDE